MRGEADLATTRNRKGVAPRGYNYTGDLAFGRRMRLVLGCNEHHVVLYS